MLIIFAFIFGIVEGLTEFLPVSSSGHMILIGNLLYFTDENAKTFEVMIQLGACLAVIFLYWRRLLIIIVRGIYLCVYKKKYYKKYLHIGHIFISILPAILIGFFLHENIKYIFFTPKYVMYALVIGGLLLFYSEYFKSKQKISTDIDNITYLQAFLIGCFQCLALFPGFSRSGATISGGLLVGVKRYAASEFSFFIAVPIIFCATILDLYYRIPFITLQYWPMFIVGFITAFIVAIISIKFILQQVIERISLVYFAIYRFILAIIVYFFLLNKKEN